MKYIQIHISSASNVPNIYRNITRVTYQTQHTRSLSHYEKKKLQKKNILPKAYAYNFVVRFGCMNDQASAALSVVEATALPRLVS
ncbi:hypothetical protein HanPSC8_Chr09g0396621 [Helianthus annuus]|nr:hypothetical protein HanPSC8_Chr09g0396621 [Helianthus annuus]